MNAIVYYVPGVGRSYHIRVLNAAAALYISTKEVTSGDCYSLQRYWRVPTYCTTLSNMMDSFKAISRTPARLMCTSEDY